jgi:hypothetical protein
MRVVNYEHPLSLPAGYTKAIGAISVGWVLRELNVQAFIWHCLKLGPQEGRTLTYALPAEKKLKLFRAMHPRWLPAAVPKAELEVLYDMRRHRFLERGAAPCRSRRVAYTLKR